MSKHLSRIIAVAVVYVLACSQPAYAYLDPGAGSLILQSIVGAVVAGAATIGLYWDRFKSTFQGKRRRDPSSAPE